MIRLWIPGRPEAQPRPRFDVMALVLDDGGRLRCGKCGARHRPVVRAVSVRDNHPSMGYRAAIRAAAQACPELHDPLEGPLQMHANFWFPRTQAQTWKRKPMPPLWKTTRPDASNILKGLEDALDGVAWQDDAQLVHVTATKRTVAGRPGGEAPAEPGTWLAIWPADEDPFAVPGQGA